MESYAGIDLHASNSYLGVIDSHDKRLFEKRLPNELDTIRFALKPFGKGLAGVGGKARGCILIIKYRHYYQG